MYNTLIPIWRSNQQMGIELGTAKRIHVTYTGNRLAESIAVVERLGDQIVECNHDTDHDYETFDELEFDADSGQLAPTGSIIIETCGKCGAVYDHEDGTYTL